MVTTQTNTLLVLGILWHANDGAFLPSPSMVSVGPFALLLAIWAFLDPKTTSRLIPCIYIPGIRLFWLTFTTAEQAGGQLIDAAPKRVISIFLYFFRDPSYSLAGGCIFLLLLSAYFVSTSSSLAKHNAGTRQLSVCAT
ncbi:uncharacterized protein P884DRAFT_61470 [Thermothelomyces heterothallicus CBS 202.75]|uniref:uncharacterized protein n=1 Tax=Thermothelomyces heterothallicus CBS 202.75 TaxID=1149848 RepID=UPI0037439DEB